MWRRLTRVKITTKVNGRHTSTEGLGIKIESGGDTRGLEVSKGGLTGYL